ncbi:MAG: TIGR04086 family membrane protein [Desulfotomaculaceae bacterium]|nr:TIGR04086 family membrane protein [Desulfotomaculaceae bacterium]MDD4767206.1 TIGR04086 family membrane protein [Desulfotomaculaceae bacterium]
MSLANIPDIKLNAVIQGTVMTLALTLIFSMAAGLIYHFSSITDSAIPWFAAGVLAVSSFLGSVSASKNAGSMGIYHGAAVGIAFFLIVCLVGGFFLAGSVAMGVVYKLIITTTAGALGGMVGVGMS